MYARKAEGNKVLFCGCMAGFFSTEMLQYKLSFKLRNLVCHFTFSLGIYICSRIELFVCLCVSFSKEQGVRPCFTIYSDTLCHLFSNAIGDMLVCQSLNLDYRHSSVAECLSSVWLASPLTVTKHQTDMIEGTKG